MKRATAFTCGRTVPAKVLPVRFVNATRPLSAPGVVLLAATVIVRPAVPVSGPERIICSVVGLTGSGVVVFRIENVLSAVTLTGLTSVTSSPTPWPSVPPLTLTVTGAPTGPMP